MSKTQDLIERLLPAFSPRPGDPLFPRDKRGRCGPSCAANGWVNDYLESCDQTSGSTGVPSAFTAVRADGFNPRALTMVGATCVVAVSAKTVCGLKAWMRHQQHDVGIVMREPAMIRDHRRAAGVGYADVRGDDNIRRPRILPRRPTTHSVVQRQCWPVVDLPQTDGCCILFQQFHRRGHALALIQPEHRDVILGCANASWVQR